MDAFRWNPCFVTGIATVDEQHRHLVDVINRFGELVMAESGATRPAVDTVFAELAEYARYHFAEEEVLMDSMRLDPAYVRAFLHAALRLGVAGRERLQYWKLLAWTLVRRPRSFVLAVTLAISGHHFRKVCARHGLGLDSQEV